MNTTIQLLTILTQSGSFIAAFAAITAGVIMSSVAKKFKTGILASGFKTISIGVILIAIGIIIDAVSSYLQLSSSTASVVILMTKEIFFVIGTYIIVIGSKNIGDNLESLTK